MHVNMGARERLTRLGICCIVFVIGIGISLGLIFSDTSRWYRLIVFPVFFCASVAGLSAQQRTCVLLAAKKKAVFEGKEVPMMDELRKQAATKRALKLLIGSLVFCVICTFIVVAIPEHL